MNLTLSKPAPEVELTGVRPGVNLVPPEILVAERVRKIQLGAGGGVAAALLVVVALYVASLAWVSSANSELASANQAKDTIASKTAKLGGVTAAYAKAQAAVGALSTAMGDEVLYSDMYQRVKAAIPGGVKVTTITFGLTPTAPRPELGSTPSVVGVSTVTLAAVAPSHDAAAAWLDALYKNTLFTDVQYTGTIETAGRPVSLTITMQLTQEALSGRYVQKAGS